jgi:phenylalanyl-tRNA synthetase beta chain
MIVSRNWLNNFVDISDISNQDILNTLDSLGLEVEAITSVCIPDKVLIGKVLECEKVEGSNKLNKCKVDVAFSSSLDIVCGASNVAKGMFVAVAIVGCKLDNGMNIEARKLKGLDSNGMICSLGELGINSATSLADGILSLNNMDKLEIGKALNSYDIFNDDIIEIELTANRGDCLNVIGIARELALKFGLPFNYEFKPQIKVNEKYKLNIKDNSKNVDFYFCLLDDKNLSLDFQKELFLSFANKSYINNAEALALYIRHTTGVNSSIYGISDDDIKNISCDNQDGFDILKINDNIQSKISIYREKKLENANKYLLEFSYINPLIANEKIYETKIKTSEELFYFTQRGSNNNLDMALNCLLSINNGQEIISNIVKKNKSYENTNIKTSFKYINNLIGNDIDKQKCIDIFHGLGFIAKEDKDFLFLTVPLYRHDICSSQDISEEILRVVGIDNIKSIALVSKDSKVNKDGYNKYLFSKNIRHQACVAGFSEHISFIFTQKKLLKEYGFATIKEDKDLINPISGELDTIKTTNIVNLLEAVLINHKHQFNDIALFEIASIFDGDRKQKEVVSFIHSGLNEKANIKNPKPKTIDFYQFAENISKVIGDFDLEIINKDEILAIYHPYQSANIIQNGKKIGIISKIHLNVLAKLKLQDTFFAEIDLNMIKKENKIYQNISKFPIVYRDLSIVMNNNQGFYMIKKHIEALNIKELVKFYPCDLYKIDKKENSISIRFELQSFNKTLEEKDIEEIVMDKIFNSLNTSLGLNLR